MRWRVILSGAATALLLAVPGASADTVVNPYAGQWSTKLGGSTPGSVRFSVIPESQGSSQLSSIGGHPCGDPTTYYHGDFSDQPDASTTQTGTMTACTSSGYLVGRWQGSGDGGDFTIQLQTQTEFDGSYNDDMYGAKFTYSGTFQAHFPGDGCCTSGGGGGGGGGSGPGSPPTGALALPTKFCPASGKCALRKALTVAEKASAGRLRKAAVKNMKDVCIDAVLRFKSDSNRVGSLLFACGFLMDEYLAINRVVKDPPDRSFTSLPPALTVQAPLARSAAITCPTSLSTSDCNALQAAVSNYTQAAQSSSTVAGYLADGANKVTGAVQGNSPASAFFQTAFAKVNAGALTVDLYDQQAYGAQLARLLSADHLGVSVGARQAKRQLHNVPRNLLPATGRSEILKLFSTPRGAVSTADLGGGLDYSGFAASYLSTSLSDLAAIVYGAYRNNHYSGTVEQTLLSDLQNAQSVCSDPNQRITAIKQFVSDTGQAGDEAHFLALGALPLLAQNVPAASCQ